MFFKGEVSGVFLVLKLWMSNSSSENSFIAGKINILYNVQWYFIYLHAYSMIMCICVYACVYMICLCMCTHPHNTQTKNLLVNGCCILWRVLKCANILILGTSDWAWRFPCVPWKNRDVLPYATSRLVVFRIPPLWIFIRFSAEKSQSIF